MQTFVVYNGVQLANGSRFTHDGVEYSFGDCRSGRATAYAVQPFGIWPTEDVTHLVELVEMPDWFIMNRRTGKQAEIGDLLAIGSTIISVKRDYVETESTTYSAYCPSSQIDFVRVTRHDQQPPKVPEYRRGLDFCPARDTGHMLMDGEWRPYREVTVFNGVYYWTGSHSQIDGSIVPHTETVILRYGNRARRSEAVEYDGEWYHINDCVEIDGVHYPRTMCIKVIDECETVIELLPPDADTSDLHPCPYAGRNHYISEEHGAEVEIDGEMVWHPADTLVGWNGESYPESWLDDNTFICEACGERFHNDDYYEDNCCTDCWHARRDDEECESDDRIQSYDCRDAERFSPEDDVPIKFGIEFEVESDSGCRSELLDAFESVLPDDYVVFKDDGSLSSETGFEIVTRPDSPAVHKRIWSGAFPRSVTSQLDISASCGIHIHVSRAPLTPLRIGRMLVFVNDPCNERLIRKIAGRYNRSYCEIREKRLSDGRFSGSSRYEAINTTGTKTIEFRIFDSGTSASPDKFIKNIEFIEALLAFTDIAESGNKSLDTPSFMRFVSKRRKDWPVLNKFLLGFC